MSRNCFEDPVSWVYLSRNCSLSHEDQNAARLPARHDVTADEDERSLGSAEVRQQLGSRDLRQGARILCDLGAAVL